MKKFFLFLLLFLNLQIEINNSEWQLYSFSTIFAQTMDHEPGDLVDYDSSTSGYTGGDSSSDDAVPGQYGTDGTLDNVDVTPNGNGSNDTNWGGSLLYQGCIDGASVPEEGGTDDESPTIGGGNKNSNNNNDKPSSRTEMTAKSFFEKYKILTAKLKELFQKKNIKFYIYDKPTLFSVTINGVSVEAPAVYRGGIIYIGQWNPWYITHESIHAVVDIQGIYNKNNDRAMNEFIAYILAGLINEGNNTIPFIDASNDSDKIRKWYSFLDKSIDQFNGTVNIKEWENGISDFWDAFKSFYPHYDGNYHDADWSYYFELIGWTIIK